jgi:hypothetical protein
VKSLTIVLVMAAALVLVASPAQARRVRYRGGYVYGDGYVTAGYTPYGYTYYYTDPVYRASYRSYRRPPYGYVVPQPPFYFGHPVYGYAYRGPWWW